MTTVKIQRWTVLTRERDDLGKLKAGAESYKRTRVPQEERDEQVLRFPNRQRVTVTFGTVAAADFLLRSGRCAGNPSWLLAPGQLKALRKLAREAHPEKKRKPRAKPAEAGPPVVAAATDVPA